MTDIKRTTTINGRQYAMFQMSPVKAIRFVPHVMTVIAQAIGSIDDVNAVLGLADGKKVDQGRVLKELAHVFGRVDPDDLSDLIEQVFANTVIHAEDGAKLKDAAFERHFQEYPGDLFQVAVWATWENSKDFLFGKDGSFLASMQAIKETRSESQKAGKMKAG